MGRVLKKRYEIVGLLGRGGMGSVYKVIDRFQGRKTYAAKELQAGNLPEDKKQESLVQFQTEARILARLTHPNLPKVSDYFSLGDRHYIIMEHVPGKTLEQFLYLFLGNRRQELPGRRCAARGTGTLLNWTLEEPKKINLLPIYYTMHCSKNTENLLFEFLVFLMFCWWIFAQILRHTIQPHFKQGVTKSHFFSLKWDFLCLFNKQK